MKAVNRRQLLAVFMLFGVFAASIAFVLRPDAKTVDLTATAAPSSVPVAQPALERQVGEPTDPTTTSELPNALPALAFVDRTPSNAPNTTTRANPNTRTDAEDELSRTPIEAAPESTETKEPGATTTTTEPASASTDAPTTPQRATTPTPDQPTTPSDNPSPSTPEVTPTSTTVPRSTSTTTTPITTTTPTTAPITTTTSSPPRPAGTRGAAGYIAPSAPTYIPVYDTAWQMLVRSTPAQADNYFAALKANGFSGAWSGIIHHAPATYNLNFAGGGQVGSMQNGELILSDAYIAHARQILDAADRHGMKVGLVAAWQNLYLPGGGADNGVGTSNAVRGTITTANAYAYGRHIATEFGDHPAVSMWVFGGDAGTNNTDANKAVWREMARGVRDTGNGLSITYHTPTSEFGQLNYAGEPWLDFIAPETGHAQDAPTTEAELRSVKAAYGTPVWQGEPRYFNINFDWVNAAFRNPGVSEVQADAQAAENAGVSGYVYGDAGRWTWCAGFGDSTPCNANNVAGSFGAGEQAVIDVFSN